MDDWSTPMAYFMDGVVRCWTIQIVVYWIMRALMGHALQLIPFLAK